MGVEDMDKVMGLWRWTVKPLLKYGPFTRRYDTAGTKTAVRQRGKHITVEWISADDVGSGNGGRFLDALPTDRHIRVTNVLSPVLRGMLERRGFQATGWDKMGPRDWEHTPAAGAKYAEGQFTMFNPAETEHTEGQSMNEQDQQQRPGMDAVLASEERDIAGVDKYELSQPGRLATTSQAVLAEVGEDIERTARAPLAALERDVDANREQLGHERVWELDAQWRRAPITDEARAQVRQDPSHSLALDAIARYRNVSECMWENADDGSGYPVPYVTDKAVADAAVADLLSARADLAQRHHPEAVRYVLSGDVMRELSTDIEDGHDCDGISFYEPHGRPEDRMIKAIERETAKDKYRLRSDVDLLATRREWKRQYDLEGLGDNFSTMRHMRADRVALDAILEERSLTQTYEQSIKRSGVGISW